MNSTPSPDPFRKVYPWLAGLFLLIVLADLAVIAWRKLPGPPLIIDRSQTTTSLAPLDPNTASVEDLRTIPALTERLARSICDYREQFRRQFPGHVAFTCPRDLDNVKGIGEKTVSKIQKYLRFPQATTQEMKPREDFSPQSHQGTKKILYIALHVFVSWW